MKNVSYSDRSNQFSKKDKFYFEKEKPKMKEFRSPRDVKKEQHISGIANCDINISTMTEQQFQDAAQAAAQNNTAVKRAKYDDTKHWSDINTTRWKAKQDNVEHDCSSSAVPAQFRAPFIKNSDETEISGVIVKIAYGVFTVKVNINYEDQKAQKRKMSTKVGEYIVKNGTLINCRLGSKVAFNNKTDAKGKNKKTGYELVEGDPVRILVTRYNVLNGGRIIKRL